MPLTTTCPACGLAFAVDESLPTADLRCPHCGAGDDAVPPPTARRPAVDDKPVALGPTAAQRRATRAKWIVLVNTTVGIALFVTAGIVWRARHRPAMSVVDAGLPGPPPRAAPAATRPAVPATAPAVIAVPATQPAIVSVGTPTTLPAVRNAAVEPPGPPVATDSRMAVPDAADVARVERLTSEVFAAQLADHTDAGQLALSQQLVAQSDEAPTPAERYALLIAARRAAVAAYQPEQALTVARRIGRQFAVDAAALRLDTLRTFPRPADATQSAALALATVDECEIAVAIDHEDEARQALSVIGPFRASLSDAAVAGRLEAVDRVLADYDRIAPDRARLAAQPDDPHANAVVGAFHLFARHDWPRGLPLAAKGDDPLLAKAARLELAGLGARSGGPDQMVDIADAWWDVAAADRWATQAPALRAHAVGLYRTAGPELRGLERRHVDQRLSDAGAPPLVAIAQRGPTVPPPVDGALPRRVVFLCDASAPVAPVLEQVKGEVERRIDGLAEAGTTRQLFNVLFFSDRVIPLVRGTAMRLPSVIGKSGADAFIEGRSAAGPCDALLAVRSALACRPDLIVLFTGGISEPGQVDEVVAALRADNPAGPTRVDCVYVPWHADPAAPAELGRISGATGGTVTTLAPGQPTAVAPPPAVAPPAHAPRHVLYVCQSSGSMVGVFQRLRQDVDTSVAALQGTGADAQVFNVIFFQDGRVTALSDQGPIPATVENKRLAIQFIGRANAAGNSAPWAALRFIAADHPDAVCLYSDGLPQLLGDRDALAQSFVRAAGPKTRIDCAYIETGESAVALRLLTDIANLTGGRLQVMRRPGM
jgi:hypothetical protein